MPTRDVKKSHQISLTSHATISRNIRYTELQKVVLEKEYMKMKGDCHDWNAFIIDLRTSNWLNSNVDLIC